MTAIFDLRFLGVLAILATILALMLGLISGAAAITTAPPMTDHARTSHQADKWGPASIDQTMRNGKCGEIRVFECEDAKIIKTCVSPSDPTKLLGLVVGAWDDTIITGYTARAKHWEGKTSRCTYKGSFVGLP